MDPCPEPGGAGRTLLGAEQERRLEAVLARSPARWHLLAPQTPMARFLPDNPHIRFAHSGFRGYARAELTPAGPRVDLGAMATVLTREARCDALASLRVEDGRPPPPAGRLTGAPGRR